ncbi:hypothetical protein HYV89_04190 [Candidatus Woesearchaeota archaeon]|nr:hypothetical protein [Candidatus Woesearchaeota archaeon]
MKLDDIAEKAALCTSVNLGIPAFILVEKYILGNIQGSFRENYNRLKEGLYLNREIYNLLEDIQNI